MQAKIEFPQFDGSNPRIWIKKCNRYFLLCKIPEDRKVDLASLHMIGKAESWVSSYLAVRASVNWQDFILDLTVRFQDHASENMVEQFNKIQQNGSLDDYVDEFEHLRSLLMQNSYILPESFVLETSIGGLKPSIKFFVKAFKPFSISAAIEVARLQEQQLAHTSFTSQKNNKPLLAPKPLQSIPFQSNYNKPPLLPTPSNTLPPLLPTPSNSTKITSKHFTRNTTHIPADVRAEKIAKGLCYYCDKPYSRGHKCSFKEPQLFTVEIMANEEGESLSPNSISATSEDGFSDQLIHLEMHETDPQISVHALSGNRNYHTMRVTGQYHGHSVHILIDSGSTYNFLDLSTTKRIGCDLQ
ncbi:Transcription factor bHLH25 [Bienertia sinuspersici]